MSSIVSTGQIVVYAKWRTAEQGSGRRMSDWRLFTEQEHIATPATDGWQPVRREVAMSPLNESRKSAFAAADKVMNKTLD